MKKFLIDKIMTSIKRKENYEETKLAEIRYGLETLYLNLTKTIVIFTLAYMLGLFKELMLILLFYGILRLTGFGLHTKKSWQCWIFSGITFILLPYLSTILILDIPSRLMISIFCIVYIFIYAPADTEKRPLINKNKRMVFRILCTISAVGLTIISLINNNNLIQNSIIISLILECFMISPLSYKIFKLKYANYKYYKKSVTV